MYAVKPYIFKDLKYPFSLPDLTFQYEALEPYFDARTMYFHHSKHHKAYVDCLNVALKSHIEYHNHTLEELLINLDKLPDGIRTAIRNYGGGHNNHSMFWQLLAVDGAKQPLGELAKKIEDELEGFDVLKERFNLAAKTHFGSGWIWLSLDREDKLVVSSTANQDSPIELGLRPFITLDVWEHAYYLKYQNRRIDYIDAWWNVLDWNRVEALYEKALEG